MVLKLYANIACSAVRAVMLCVKALELEVEWINVNLEEKEHLTAEYLKINPQHTIPVLDDDGFIIIDSHAIMAYLVSKYGKDDSLYPEDLKERATVHHRLHFNSNILLTRGMVYLKDLISEDKSNTKKNVIALEEAFNITEKYLGNRSFIAGNELTIADFSIVASITSWAELITFSEVRFPRIFAWIKRLEDLPYYHEGNQIGLNKFISYVKDNVPK